MSELQEQVAQTPCRAPVLPQLQALRLHGGPVWPADRGGKKPSQVHTWVSSVYVSVNHGCWSSVEAEKGTFDTQVIHQGISWRYTQL